MNEKEENFGNKLETTISTLLPLWLIQGISVPTVLVGACPLIVYGLKKLIGYFKPKVFNGTYSKYVSLMDKDRSRNRVYTKLIEKLLDENKNLFFDEMVFDCHRRDTWHNGENVYAKDITINRELDLKTPIKIKLYGKDVMINSIKREVEFSRDSSSVTGAITFLEISSNNSNELNEIFETLYEDAIKRDEYYLMEKEIDGICTFEYEGKDKEWRLIPIKINKTFDNNPIDEKIQTEIIENIKLFDVSEDYYKKVGQPYKSGFLFYGKPGTGKTSFILTLANELKKKIYYGNEELIYSDFPAKVMMGIKPGSLLVFEDVDLVIKSLISRRDKECKKDNDKDKDEKSIKIVNENGFGSLIKSFRESIFRRVLEVLDGYKFLYGIIVIFTTNYKDDIDPALIRPGRIDYCYEFKECTPLQIEKICNLYDINNDEFKEDSITSAALISKCKSLGKRKRKDSYGPNKLQKQE